MTGLMQIHLSNFLIPPNSSTCSSDKISVVENPAVYNQTKDIQITFN